MSDGTLERRGLSVDHRGTRHRRSGGPSGVARKMAWSRLCVQLDR